MHIPSHHAIARGMAWVTLFVFLGKLVGAAKEMTIAYRYGISDQVDAYLFIYNLIIWPVGVWFSILTVVVALAARIRQAASAEPPRLFREPRYLFFPESNRKEGGQLYGIAMFWVRLMIVFGVVTLIISWWLAPWIIKLLFERGAFTARILKL